MALNALKTELEDRVLRYDGVSIVDPESIPKLLMKGIRPDQLRVLSENIEVELFNRFSPENPIKVDGKEPITFDRTWQLPEKYADLDMYDYLINVFDYRLEELGYDEAQQHEAAQRMWGELDAFKRNGLIDLLRCLVYVLDVFHEHKVVYGVGRGSSCASFVLFLIGVHMVDPIKYNIPVEEFIREEAGGDV